MRDLKGRTALLLEIQLQKSRIAEALALMKEPGTSRERNEVLRLEIQQCARARDAAMKSLVDIEKLGRR